MQLDNLVTGVYFLAFFHCYVPYVCPNIFINTDPHNVKKLHVIIYSLSCEVSIVLTGIVKDVLKFYIRLFDMQNQVTELPQKKEVLL